MHLGKRVLMLLAMQCGFAALVLVATSRWASSIEATECQQSVPAADVRSIGVIAARLRIEQPTSSLAFQFGGARGTRSRDLALGLIDGTQLLDAPLRPRDGEALAVRVPRLVDNATQQQIPRDLLQVQARYDEAERAVRFEVCVDVSHPDGFGAGSYQGVATLTDGRFVEIEIPVWVTLRSNDRMGPMLVALVGGLIGGVWGMLSPFAVIAKAGATPRRALRAEARRLLVISGALGLAAGAFTFWRMFVEDGDFRGSGADWRTVLTAAFVTAAALYPAASLVELFWAVTFGREDEPSGSSPPTSSPTIATGGRS